MLRNFLIASFCSLLFCTVSEAQIPTLSWIKKAGGKYYDRILDMHIDAQKNLILVGQFQDTVDFDPGPGVFKLITSVNGGFVVKLDSMGSFIWAKKLDGNNYCWPYNVKTDNAGNIYMTGAFSGTTDFDPGAGTFTLNSVSAVPKGDAFALKLTSAGNFVWAKSWGGKGTDMGSNITLDNSQNLYIDGSFQDSVDFDPGAGVNLMVSNTPSNSSSSQAYIMKLDNSGNFVWSGSLKASNGNAISDHVQDANGYIYVAGAYSGVTDFDFGPGTYTLDVPQNSVAFLAKYSPSGAIVWAKGSTYASGFNVYTDGIALDNLGYVYAVGVGGLAINFSIGCTTLNAQGGTADAFIVKYDTSGNYQWLKGYGSYSADDYIQSLSIDANNNLYISGNFPLGSGNDFDPDPVNTFSVNHSPVNNLESYVLKTDNNGLFKWVVTNSMTTPTITQQSIIQIGTTLDTYGNIYNFGGFTGPADWDPSPASFTLTTLTNQPWDTDLYLQKLAQPQVMTGLAENHNDENFSVYPNPVQSNLNIICNEKINRIEIVSISGQVVNAGQFLFGQNAVVNTENLSGGMYFVKVFTEKGLLSKKFVKQ